MGLLAAAARRSSPSARGCVLTALGHKHASVHAPCSLQCIHGMHLDCRWQAYMHTCIAACVCVCVRACVCVCVCSGAHTCASRNTSACNACIHADILTHVCEQVLMITYIAQAHVHACMQGCVTPRTRMNAHTHTQVCMTHKTAPTEQSTHSPPQSRQHSRQAPAQEGLRFRGSLHQFITIQH